MDTILEFFEPDNVLNIWIGKFFLVSISSYFFVWILALIFCRVGWKVGGDNQLKVYFSWLFPFVFHMLLTGIFLILASFHFKQVGISLGYSIPYALLVLLSGNYANTINNKIKERTKKLERRINE